MNIEFLKKIVYKTLIDSNEMISRSFSEYLESINTDGDYWNKILKVIQLNCKFRIFRKKNIDADMKRLPFPEYKECDRLKGEEMIKELRNADIVSFDVFDTLVFRVVEKPRDVFRLLEAENHIMKFAKYREEAEREARRRNKNKEITIENIYELLEEMLGIDKEQGIQQEIDMEKKVCFANPYLKNVWMALEDKKKIVSSDMYLPQTIIRDILGSCGYQGISEIFVSCDINKTKATGQLQKYIAEQLGTDKKYIHVGDNYKSDIKQSLQCGWKALYYKNIYKLGKLYRRSEMRTIASSVYKGLVNAKLYSGAYSEDAFYEYGYVYGGILAVGYCQYLCKLSSEKKIDQFLFLARDGYIIKKLYDEMSGYEVSTEYVPFSRYASYQLTMERNWRSFLKYVIKPRILEEKKIKEVFRECDIEFLMNLQQQYNIEPEKKFTETEFEILKRIYRENIDWIAKQCKSTCEGAEKYFRKIIGNKKNIYVVDIGWQGTGANCLKYFLEEKCNMNVEVHGVVMGTANNETTDVFISNEDMMSYLFSTQHNSQMLRRHSAIRNDRIMRDLLVEVLFTEDNPSFWKFDMDWKGNTKFVYAAKESNHVAIENIQRGIFDFAAEYLKMQKKLGSIMNICGQEAYIPLDGLAQNKKYVKTILKNCNVCENSTLG